MDVVENRRLLAAVQRHLVARERKKVSTVYESKK